MLAVDGSCGSGGGFDCGADELDAAEGCEDFFVGEESEGVEIASDCACE